MEVTQYEWDEIMKEIRANNAVFLNKHITKTIKVKDCEPKYQTIVSKADYFNGFEVIFFDPSEKEEMPF